MESRISVTLLLVSTPLLELDEMEFRCLISGLIDRRLPSFSMWGRSEVLQGALAGVLLDLDFAKVARRVALNAQKIVSLEPPQKLNCFQNSQEFVGCRFQYFRSSKVGFLNLKSGSACREIHRVAGP